MPTYADLVTTLRSAGCVFAEDEARLLRAAEGDLATLVARRVAGEPLEWVLGWVEFAGLRVTVQPGVFVPRRRSELLAAEAIARLGERSVAVELCCGAAPIATAMRHAVPSAEVHATDVDSAAVACARQNLTAARVHQGDLFAALPVSLRGRIDVLVANTPYVPSSEVALMPVEAREHEPRHTLDGGPDGLDLLRRISAEAPEWLAPGGWLLIEVARRQQEAALSAFASAHLQGGSIDDDGTVVVTGRLVGADHQVV